MIARINESIYLYAQDLDNSGKASCLRSIETGEYHELHAEDPERLAVIREIDNLQNRGRVWPIGAPHLECRVNFYGNCLIVIRPLTLDQSGRIAPISLLFNALSSPRRISARTLSDCQSLMHRNLSSEHLTAIAKLGKIMRRPSWVIALHILFFSRANYD